MELTHRCFAVCCFRGFLPLRYVEANAQRAKLVRAAQDWRWGSLWVRQRGDSKQRQMLSQGFVDLPADWPVVVNEA